MSRESKILRINCTYGSHGSFLRKWSFEKEQFASKFGKKLELSTRNRETLANLFITLFRKEIFGLVSAR